MKLLKRFCILLLLMAVLLLFFVGMANVRASAETPEISVIESVAEEVVESEEEYPQRYSMTDTDGKTAIIELFDLDSLKLTLYMEDAVEVASMNGWYIREENVIDMYAEDGTYFGRVELFEDGTARYVDEDVETSEETTSEYFGIIPETEGSKWFEEHIQPYLMDALSALATVFACIALLIKPIKKIIVQFKNAKDELVSNNKENAEMRKNNDTWKAEVKAELKAEMDKRLSAVEKETHETNVGVKKLLKVKRIVYINNPSMVSTGTSHKVAEVLNHDETQKE